jgi:hypothetical protein
VPEISDEEAVRLAERLTGSAAALRRATGPSMPSVHQVPKFNEGKSSPHWSLN